MTEYEQLQTELVEAGTIIDEDSLGPGDPSGLYLHRYDKPALILINKGLSPREKLCVLAEEAGHHYKTYGPAIDEKNVTQRKNELAGRKWAYQRLVPIDRIIDAWQEGCRSTWSMAQYFGVTESFFRAAVEHYHTKYGVEKNFHEWVIKFDPHFVILHIPRH